jgi:hypothetical protein
MKRFRAEGDFLVRALVDFVVLCRSQIGRLQSEFAELEKLAGEHELPPDVLQAMSHLARRRTALGLTETQLRERLNHLRELHILPEHRTPPDPDSEGETESTG